MRTKKTKWCILNLKQTSSGFLWISLYKIKRIWNQDQAHDVGVLIKYVLSEAYLWLEVCTTSFSEGERSCPSIPSKTSTTEDGELCARMKRTPNIYRKVLSKRGGEWAARSCDAPGFRAQFSSLWKEITPVTRTWCLGEATLSSHARLFHFRTRAVASLYSRPREEEKNPRWKTMQRFEPMETWHIVSFYLRTDSAPDSPSSSRCPCPSPIYATASSFVAAQSWPARFTKGNDARRARPREERNFLETSTFAHRWTCASPWMWPPPGEDPAMFATRVKSPSRLGVTGRTRSLETWLWRKNMGIGSCPTRW